MTDLIARAIAATSPHADAAMWSAALGPFMTAGGLTSPRRIAAFIGQVTWESTQFSTLEENLNYSAERLMAVWPSRFTSPLGALPYEHNPEALANNVYANRMGNGDEASGDGWLCRGAGLVQLTGHDNQAKFAAAIGMDVALVGDFLRTPKGAAQSAVWFWQSKGLNRYADRWQLTMMTQLINGGTDGLQHRIDLCNLALHAISSAPAAPATTE